MRSSPFILAVFLLGCSGGSGGYFSPTHPGVLHAGSYAQDHRNVPDYAKLLDYDYVSLSPRAQANGGPVGGTPAAENLIAAGVKVLFVTFPCYFHYQGKSLPVGDQERDIEDLAKQYDGKLMSPSGSQQFAYGCYVLDFRNHSFVNALVKFWVKRIKIGNGILLHEACGGIPTEDPKDPFYYPKVSQAELDWENGYHYYVSELRRARPDWEVISVCDRWESSSPNGQWRSDLFDGLFFENIPSSLNPVGQKTFDQLKIGTRNVVAFYDVSIGLSNPNYRRGAAAMAIARDGLFLYGQEATITKNMEHFDIYYGDFPTAAKEISPGVWERIGTHGLVVFNESGAIYNYVDPMLGQAFMLSSPDGLSAQFKDKTFGTDLGLGNWITNYLQ